MTIGYDGIFITSEKFFALKFSSFIKIPADGLYWFNIDATGRVMMTLHGAEMHRRPSAWSRTVAEFSVGLKAGYHPVDIYFLQDEFDSELKIECEGPGITRQALPENIFFIEE